KIAEEQIVLAPAPKDAAPSAAPFSFAGSVGSSQTFEAGPGGTRAGGETESAKISGGSTVMGPSSYRVMFFRDVPIADVTALLPTARILRPFRYRLRLAAALLLLLLIAYIHLAGPKLVAATDAAIELLVAWLRDYSDAAAPGGDGALFASLQSLS